LKSLQQGMDAITLGLIVQLTWMVKLNEGAADRDACGDDPVASMLDA
jgi:hypothetical protein